MYTYDLFTFLYHVVFNKMFIKVKNTGNKRAEYKTPRMWKKWLNILEEVRFGKRKSVCMVEGTDDSCSG